MKKTLSIILALCFILSMTVFMASAEETATPSAEIGHALQTIINTSKPRESLTFTLENINAQTEVKVELWSGETHLSTTVLREADLDDATVAFYPVVNKSYTVNIVVSGKEAGSWATEWHAPRYSFNLPDTIKVYIDGSAEPIDTLTQEGGVFLTEAFKEQYIALDAVKKPANLEYAVVNVSDPAEYFISVGMTNLNASESVVLETYKNDTLLATTTLTNSEYFVCEDELSAKIIITGDSSSWSTVWEDKKLSSKYVPNKIKLVVDGVVEDEIALAMVDTMLESVNWAEIIPTRLVNSVSTKQGNVTVSTDVANIGETVYVTVAPKYGWKLVEILVVDSEGELVAVNGNSFVMPENNVTVSAVYEEAYPVPEKIFFTASVAGVEAGECKFELSYDFNGTNSVIEVAKDNENGEVNFAPVFFNGAGTYTYYIKQIAGDNASVDYDATVYTISVKVVYTVDGELVATVAGEAAAFTNVAK